MKKILALLALSIMIASADSIMIDKINHTIDQLKYEASQKPRINLDIKYDPFYHDKKMPVAKHTKPTTTAVKKAKNSLILSMILNKKAFINGIWYRENQKVAHYMLTKINQDNAVLKRKNKTIVLKLETADNLLIKKEVQ